MAQSVVYMITLVRSSSQVTSVAVLFRLRGAGGRMLSTMHLDACTVQCISSDVYSSSAKHKLHAMRGSQGILRPSQAHSVHSTVHNTLAILAQFSHKRRDAWGRNASSQKRYRFL